MQKDFDRLVRILTIAIGVFLLLSVVFGDTTPPSRGPLDDGEAVHVFRLYDPLHPHDPFFNQVLGVHNRWTALSGFGEEGAMPMPTQNSIQLITRDAAGLKTWSTLMTDGVTTEVTLVVLYPCVVQVRFWPSVVATPSPTPTTTPTATPLPTPSPTPAALEIVEFLNPEFWEFAGWEGQSVTFFEPTDVAFGGGGKYMVKRGVLRATFTVRDFCAGVDLTPGVLKRGYKLTGSGAGTRK